MVRQQDVLEKSVNIDNLHQELSTRRGPRRVPCCSIPLVAVLGVPWVVTAFPWDIGQERTIEKVNAPCQNDIIVDRHEE
jgi:hypothetical protein